MIKRMIVAAGIAVIVACGPREEIADTAASDTMNVPSALNDSVAQVMAVVRDASGRELGTLVLAGSSGGISVSGQLRGLAPGEHAMHLHGVGRCDPPAFESAGEHWNPTSRRHGRDNPQGPHHGDLPNVTVGTDSLATVQAVTAGGMLRGDSTALLDTDGAAVIVHAGSDDYRTDSAGASGNPIACGVVTG